MIKLAQSTINEDERKRILYQSLMVIILCISLVFYNIIYNVNILLNLGIERSSTKVKFDISLFTIYKLCLYGRCISNV